MNHTELIKRQERAKDGPFRYFLCPACDKDNEMDKDQLITHLAAAHGVDAYKHQATREMVAHFNMKPRHQGVFKWTIQGVEFYEYYG